MYSTNLKQVTYNETKSKVREAKVEEAEEHEQESIHQQVLVESGVGHGAGAAAARGLVGPVQLDEAAEGVESSGQEAEGAVLEEGDKLKLHYYLIILELSCQTWLAQYCKNCDNVDLSSYEL